MPERNPEKEKEILKTESIQVYCPHQMRCFRSQRKLKEKGGRRGGWGGGGGGGQKVCGIRNETNLDRAIEADHKGGFLPGKR